MSWLPFGIRRVVGGSMLPTLNQGDIVVYWRRKPRMGELVVAQVDGRDVVKRVVLVHPDSSVDLAGDNTASNHYQFVPQAAMLGVLLWPRHL